MRPAYRYIVRDILTGQVLTWNLPLVDVSYGPELNGPGALTGRLSPRFVASDPQVIDPGNRFVYVERDGLLRWGGILWKATPQNADYALEAAGWSSYLQRRHDIHGELDGRGPYVNADPCRVLRDIWAYCQSLPDGDIGVTVDGTTSTATVGTPAEPLHSSWWETPVLGDMADGLVDADDSPDYTCAVAWGPDGAFTHRLQVGYPRLGARRADIRFSTGVNIIDSPPVDRSGDDYANTVIGTGAGEGRSMLRAVDSVRDGRLRLECVLPLPQVKGSDILARRTAADRKRRQILGSVEQITVRPDHPAAPYGAYQVGDDVLVDVHNVWASYTGWARILGWTVQPGGDSGESVVIDLARADSYHYGAA